MDPVPVRRERHRATTPPQGYRATGTVRRRCRRARPADRRVAAPRLRRRRCHRRPSVAHPGAPRRRRYLLSLTTITRLGCSWLAALAASIDSSSSASLSGAITSVKTRPRLTAPDSSSSEVEFLGDLGSAGLRQIHDHRRRSSSLPGGYVMVSAIPGRSGAACRRPMPDPRYPPHTDRAYRAPPNSRARDRVHPRLIRLPALTGNSDGSPSSTSRISRS